MNNETNSNVVKVEVPAMLSVAPAPHVHHKNTTAVIMRDVLIALAPALAWSVYVFGLRALLVCLVCVASCVGFEALTEWILKRPITITDLSAAVTGLLLGFNLPSTAPFWLCIVGSAFAIIVVKQVFGGLGHNVFNPALAARVFLFLAWPSRMATFTAPFDRLLFSAVDIEASATPLKALKALKLGGGALPSESLLDVFLGKCGGVLGEVSALFLLLGGIYLIGRKVITWHIPVAYIGTVALLTFIFPLGGASRPEFMLYEILTGGLFLGAIFMATDYVTSPVTPVGRIIYGVGCGLLTVFIRYFGGYPEGVSFSILIMNSLVWYLERATRPHVFGEVKKNAKK